MEAASGAPTGCHWVVALAGRSEPVRGRSLGTVWVLLSGSSSEPLTEQLWDSTSAARLARRLVLVLARTTAVASEPGSGSKTESQKVRRSENTMEVRSVDRWDLATGIRELLRRERGIYCLNILTCGRQISKILP
jgi:hypothetical protein